MLCGRIVDYEMPKGYIHLIIRIKNKTYFGFETVAQI